MLLDKIISMSLPEPNISVSDNTAILYFPSSSATSNFLRQCTHDPRDPLYLRFSPPIDRDLPVQPLIPSVETVYPLPFETNGPSWVLSQEGVFWEEESGWYFYPKRGVYWGGGKWWVWERVLVPPFREVEGEEFKEVEKPSQPPLKKPKISISMKGIKKTRKKDANHNLIPQVISKNLETWSQRTKELTETKPKTVDITSEKIVCLLCRRKFKSVETLKKHEKESEMHLSNLRRKGKKGIYIDEKVEKVEKVNEKEKVEVKKEDLGMKMLKKMGWKDGEKESEMVGRIREEWDKNI
ncbi:hypothetical protein TrVE_jg4469 [Triparma verrucosa]|uniref:G-patch domain-containing protein n=1 Tax=Triparma verrucosa TaxID=1606542 RepID=A0A9W7FDV3_9STRA|nr:hypothetical protein TrVE_jg4469 [Triparma verrucosa]